VWWLGASKERGKGRVSAPKGRGSAPMRSVRRSTGKSEVWCSPYTCASEPKENEDKSERGGA
jgi:hypothetical protein